MAFQMLYPRDMRFYIPLLSVAMAFCQTAPNDTLPPYPQPVKPSPVPYTSIHDVNLRKALGISAKGFFRDKSSEPGIHYEKTLAEIHYLRGPSSGKDTAVLVISHWFWVGASSASGGTGEVYVLSAAGQLRSIQKLQWDTHFNPGHGLPDYSFDPHTRTLVFRSANYAKDDAHCCPSSFDTDTYRWNGRRFALVSRQRTSLR